MTCKFNCTGTPPSFPQEQHYLFRSHAKGDSGLGDVGAVDLILNTICSLAGDPQSLTQQPYSVECIHIIRFGDRNDHWAAWTALTGNALYRFVMKTNGISISSLVAAGFWSAILLTKAQVNVTQFHNHASRDGLYIDPVFTQSAAANLVHDLNFDGTISGDVYAQPLYIACNRSNRGVIRDTGKSPQA